MEFSITRDTCRICLKKPPSSSKHLGDRYGPISAEDDCRTYLDIYMQVTMITELVSVVTSPSSGSSFFPQKICENCEAQLIVVYEFQRKSCRSEKILQNILSLYDEEDIKIVVDNQSEIVKEEHLYETIEEPIINICDNQVSCEMHITHVEEQNESVEVNSERRAKEDETLLLQDTFHPIEHDYEAVIDESLVQEDDEIGYVVEEFMDDGNSNDDDGNFYGVQSADSTSKTRQCPDCGKSVSKRYLAKHRNIHKDKCDRERPHECDQCKARFTLRENLLKHKRIHSNEKRYSCPFCHEQFLHWASRRYHIASHHTGEKRFTCEYCGAKFRNSSHYSIHIRRHTGVAPYPCHLCDRSFITGNSLKLHMLSHSDSKNFHCDLCQKSYKSAKSLGIHKKTSHEQEKNYICPLCNRAFSQNHVLKTHLLRHHPNYEPPPPGTIVNARAVRRINEQLEKINEQC